MRLYHVAPTEEADRIRREGATSSISRMQGGGFYLWSSRASAEAYVNDPWMLRKTGGRGAQVLAFEVNPSDLVFDTVLNVPHIRSWSQSVGLDFFPGIRHPRQSRVLEFIESLTEREREEMNAFVLERVLKSGGAVKYVGTSRIYPLQEPTLVEMVLRRLLRACRESRN